MLDNSICRNGVNMYKKAYSTKINSIIILIMYIILYANSCDFISFDYFSVECSISDKKNYFYQQEITLSFSKPIEINSLEAILSLKMENQSIPFSIRPKGNNSFVIKPLSLWQKGAMYRFSVIGQVKQKNGSSYAVSLVRDFIYGKKEHIFMLNYVSVPNNDFESLKMPIVFSFNKAINKASFIQGFSISPNNQFDIVFSDNLEQVSVFPKEQWAINKIFTWNLENISSLDGYLLNKDNNGKFYTYTDTDLPILTNICPVIETQTGYIRLTDTSLDSLEGTQGIGFSFSKPILFDSLVSSINFQPNIPGTLKWDPNDPTKFFWIPSEQWQVGVLYHLEITTSVKDLNYLPLFQSESLSFTPSTKYLVLEKIKFGLETEITDFSKDFYQCSLDYTNDDSLLGIELFFSSAIPQENRTEALESISLNSFFPLTASNPKLNYVRWSQDGRGLYLRWSDFSSSSGEREVFYRLVISNKNQGIINSKGESLQEEICLLIKML